VSPPVADGGDDALEAVLNAAAAVADQGYRPSLLVASPSFLLGLVLLTQPGSGDHVFTGPNPEEFQALDVELLSISPDPVDAWREAGGEMSLQDFDTALADPGNKVAASYGLMQWQMAGEPGHTFVLIDESRTISWVRDYGAPENGGMMYVVPQNFVEELTGHL